MLVCEEKQSFLDALDCLNWDSKISLISSCDTIERCYRTDQFDRNSIDGTVL